MERMERLEIDKEKAFLGQSSKMEGRPLWWFKGSYFIPKTAQDHRMMVLHRQITIKNENILSDKAKKVQRVISPLNQWFPVNLLDDACSLLLKDENQVTTTPEIIIRVLGIVEAKLRTKKMSIRWKVLFEISENLGITITKSAYARYMFQAKKQLFLPPFDRYGIIKRFIIDQIASRSVNSTDEKREYLEKANSFCNYLKKNQFEFKDPELMGLAISRLILGIRGSISQFPILRKKISRLVYRLKQEWKKWDDMVFSEINKKI